MKKAIETKNLACAIYPFEVFRKISDLAYWGEDLDHITAIDGELAEKVAAKDNVQISGSLTSGVLYIFHWNKAGTKLVPLHVSMKPKTAANIENGSRRYGSGAILNELF